MEIDDALEYESLESFDLDNRNYLVYIGGYRVYKEKGENEEARKPLEAIEKISTGEIIEENKEI